MSKVAEVMKMLNGLESSELAEVMDVLKKTKAQVRRAEVKLMEEYPTCSCGKPIILLGHFRVSFNECKPALRMHKDKMAACIMVHNTYDGCKYDEAMERIANYSSPEVADEALGSLFPEESLQWVCDDDDDNERTSMIGSCGCGSWAWVSTDTLNITWVGEDEFKKAKAFEWTSIEHLVKAADVDRESA